MSINKASCPPRTMLTFSLTNVCNRSAGLVSAPLCVSRQLLLIITGQERAALFSSCIKSLERAAPCREVFRYRGGVTKRFRAPVAGLPPYRFKVRLKSRRRSDYEVYWYHSGVQKVNKQRTSKTKLKVPTLPDPCLIKEYGNLFLRHRRKNPHNLANKPLRTGT